MKLFYTSDDVINDDLTVVDDRYLKVAIDLPTLELGYTPRVLHNTYNLVIINYRHRFGVTKLKFYALSGYEELVTKMLVEAYNKGY